MTERWKRVAEVFDSAVDREATERASFVREACAGDPGLRREVESLLAEADRPVAPVMIDGPIEEVVAGLLADNGPVMVGTRHGPYRIDSLLGVGGMGEVYRALDTVLGRQVAIKVLPAAFAADEERLARFKREAQILASLNHPNIGAIYGLEKLEGQDRPTVGLVLELVEGPTLAETLHGQALPVDEAIALARQIASALEAAHDQGIVHRDLKPGNIKVRGDGTVKVLDFGLAKAMEPTAVDGTPRAGPTDSPTITSPAMTAAGTILGTAAYMSPEQAKGKPADKRSDIWAFGCVIYEMLTGARPFAGDNMADVLASVLAREPDWSRLPATLSPALGIYLKRCLNKNPKQRVGDVQDVRLALEGAFDGAAPPSAAPTHLSARWRMAALASVVLGVVAAAGAAVWFTTRQVESVPPRVVRLQVTSSDAAAFTISADSHALAITPDGSRLIYIGDRGRQIFVRTLDALEPVSVHTGTPYSPFVSPDGQWIGFVELSTLKKVPITGGPAVTLAALDASTPRGVTWGPDDTIVFATSNPTTGLQRVAAEGGSTTVLTRADRALGEADHGWPEWLPGGHSVLFTISAVQGGSDAAQVAVLNLQTGARTVLLRGGTNPRYVASGVGAPTRAQCEGGHIVYATAGTLRAVPFDPVRLELRGTPVAVVADVVTTDTGAVNAMVAGNGTLAYAAGSAVSQLTRTLVWVDRQGRETPIPAPPRAYVHPRLSSDGTRVAVFTADQEIDIWLWDFVRATLTRVTSSPGVDNFPLWAPDDRQLIFSSQRTGAANLFRQAADGAGAVERLTESSNPTPLMYAALYAGPDVIRRLIDRGAQVNASNTFGATALMWAASRTENVRALLERGADVNARASNGWTALVTATRYGNTGSMKLLLAAGAQTTSPEDRRNVLSASYLSTNPAVRDVLRDAQVVPSSGADLTGTVLDRTRDDVPTLVRLLKLGVNPKEEVPLITVALPTFFMAAREGQVDAMRAFVSHGVDATHKGARGWTALMLAASADRSSIPTLEYLLDNGADINARDEDGRTAIDWALTRGETEVSAFLRKAGARTSAVPVAAPASVTKPRAARDAIEHAIARLQPAGPAFSNRTNCVSCHNQSIPGIAIELAKVRGLKIDTAIASHSVSVTEESWRKRREAVLVGDTFLTAASGPYGLLERVEAGLPPTVDTDAMVIGLASRQTMDGSWQSANEIRPRRKAR